VQRRGVSVVLFLVGLILAIAAHASEGRPVNSTDLMAWLTAGVPCNRLIRIIQQRGIASIPNNEQIRQFEAAGANPILIRTLSNLKPSSAMSPVTPQIPPSLIQAAISAQSQRFHEADLDLRQAVSADPQNAALHFALGSMLRQQERWDDAFDEITLATRLMPDFPENHSGLAYIFYRLDDGPNAIAEARTALSMDPQNAEAYQFLGLGLFSNGQYGAAVHAFIESLARDAGNPDTYYDLGITLHADGNLPAALAAYRQAIRLNPGFWEAHSNLALILHEAEANSMKRWRNIAKPNASRPQEASVRNNLGNTYCDKGDYDAAIVGLREPAIPRASRVAARATPVWPAPTCRKRITPARPANSQLAVRQNPNPARRSAALLGEALLLNDKVDEAVHELRLAVTLNPDSDAAHHLL
jgi:Flp pilus assembly protein TadD